MTDVTIRNLTDLQLADLQRQLCPDTPEPPEPPVPPVPPDSIYVGEIYFNGARLVSTGMDPTHRNAFGKLMLPVPFPDGKVSSISVYEYASSPMFRIVALSKSIGDFTNRGPNYVVGMGSNLYVSFNVDRPGYMRINSGETWYLNIKNEYPNGSPSCYPTVNCNFAVNAAVPSR